MIDTPYLDGIRNMSLIFISEYNQTYHTHTSCYYCLDLTLCYPLPFKNQFAKNHQKESATTTDYYSTVIAILQQTELAKILVLNHSALLVWHSDPALSKSLSSKAREGIINVWTKNGKNNGLIMLL